MNLFFELFQRCKFSLRTKVSVKIDTQRLTVKIALKVQKERFDCYALGVIYSGPDADICYAGIA